MDTYAYNFLSKSFNRISDLFIHMIGSSLLNKKAFKHSFSLYKRQIEEFILILETMEKHLTTKRKRSDV